MLSPKIATLTPSSADTGEITENIAKKLQPIRKFFFIGQINTPP
jgi:hypothetical protein